MGNIVQDDALLKLNLEQVVEIASPIDSKGAGSKMYGIKTETGQEYILKIPESYAYRTLRNFLGRHHYVKGESEILKSLKGKGVAPEYIKEFDDKAILMGYVPHEKNLKDVLKEYQKKEDYCFDYVSVISQIKKLHDSGVCHGDMKAKNVLINSAPHIIDFEYAEFLSKDKSKREKQIKKDIRRFANDIVYNKETQAAMVCAVKKVYGNEMADYIERTQNSIITKIWKKMQPPMNINWYTKSGRDGRYKARVN